jgi:hypothetical protein
VSECFLFFIFFTCEGELGDANADADADADADAI